MFYLTTRSTYFIYGYMATDHSDSERGNPISSKASFIMHHRTYMITHTTSRGAMAGTRNSSMGYHLMATALLLLLLLLLLLQLLK